MRVVVVLVAVCSVLGWSPAAAGAAEAASPAAVDAVAGELIVAYDRSATPAERAAARSAQGVEKLRDLDADGLELVRLKDGGRSVHHVASALGRQRAVRFAEPNVRFRVAAAMPNDPLISNQWALHNTGQTGGTPDADIDGPEAWEIAADTSDVVVAVIDTGVDITHPDLAANVWVNQGETRNGVDDDRNGYVDDLNGWDFVHDDASVFDEADGDEHGTHVAGVISAATNNSIGTAGISRARIMTLKFLAADGSGTSSDAISALDYAIRMGARVTNNSWGGAGHSRALGEKIAAAEAAGQLFVAAAGNGGDDGIGDDLDVSPEYPASYTHSNVVTVASTDARDIRSTFSNYGVETVDLAAPGGRIVSTVPGGWASMSGTSMAAPQVTGAVAHLLAKYPNLLHTEIASTLTGSGETKTSLIGVTVSGRRLNLAAALAAPATTVEQPVDEPAQEPAPAPAGDLPITVTATLHSGGDAAVTPLDLTETEPGYLALRGAFDVAGTSAMTLDVVVQRDHLPLDAPLESVTPLRDGVVAGPCTTNVDPCVEAVTADGGEVRLRVSSERGGRWTFGVPEVARIAGPNRAATAIASSRASFAAGEAGAVVVARSDSFPDALAGAALAVAVNAPLLLTAPDHLEPAVADEIGRVLGGSGRVYLLGGTSALSDGVADGIVARGYSVERLSGTNRYETAVAIADETAAVPAAIFVTTGASFPDALAASTAAPRAGAVVVLTDGPLVPAATRDYLERHATVPVFAIGGPAASALPDATPLVGVDRFDTALRVADRFFVDPPVIGVATGWSFPDALSAGARLGRIGAPLILAGDSLSGDALALVGGATRAEVFGGTAAVSETVAGALDAAIG